jgi:hypothetical protein
MLAVVTIFMVKCAKTLIDACRLFLQYNKVEIGYPNSDMKRLGRKRIILVNGVRVHKKRLGGLIFVEVERHKPFEKKWSTLCDDLAEQLLSGV